MPLILHAIQMVFALLAIISFATLLWQWGLAVFYPLHQRHSVALPLPAATILKPLKGCEPDTEACLRSWLELEYAAPVQILFGVAREDDPVCAIVRRLLVQNPAQNARLVICGESLGSNAKVSSLIQMQRAAEHDIIVISDADVKVTPDFLSQIIGALADKSVGLVNCLYALANPSTPAMRWEAVAINADFWSQVLQSQSLAPLDYALGAVMAVRRESLDAIGGFDVLADYLADDFQLGHRLHLAGYRVILSPLVAQCYSGPMSWRQVWDHQLRWARTIRFSKPIPYALSLISNPTIWPIAWFMASFNPSVGIALVGFLVVRILVGLDLQRRLMGSWPGWPFMVLLKDLFSLAIWICSWGGSEVQWRGTRFQVLRGGKLRALGAVTAK